MENALSSRGKKWTRAGVKVHLNRKTMDKGRLPKSLISIGKCPVHQCQIPVCVKHEIDLECSMAKVIVGKNQVLISILRDVSERLAADVERQAARTQLSHLTRRLMSQEKDLVKRIARVLHD